MSPASKKKVSTKAKLNKKEDKFKPLKETPYRHITAG
jgi:hypothetical protein